MSHPAYDWKPRPPGYGMRAIAGDHEPGWGAHHRAVKPREGMRITVRLRFVLNDDEGPRS